jgi:N6-L-threonylcarbamoyladenine synthase
MLGLGYPGGPEIEKYARDGNAGRFDLPRSMPGSEDFSFSGLKTAVRYLLPKLDRGISNGSGTDEPVDESKTSRNQDLADVCASFQQAVIDVLVRKAVRAAKTYRVNLVTLSGGVSCNQELCRQLEMACRKEGLEFRSAANWLSTDNAAMIAFTALLHLQRGLSSPITEEIDPNLALA